jgi:cytochrome P450
MSAPSTDLDLDRVDLTDLDLFADGPPYELFRRMRREMPVHWNEMDGEPGFWNITRFEDIRRISRDHETFSNERGGIFIQNEPGVPVDVQRQLMLGMDPPRHTKVRGIVQKVFSPRVVAEREPHIRQVVTRLIDDVIERGECDFVSDIAVELPLIVIAEMLGVPVEDRYMLFDWTNRASHAVATADPADTLQALAEMGQYLGALVAERRERPRDDLISRMVNAEVDGERLSDAEITISFGLLMFAGNDTTRNTASGAMLALIEHPDQRQKLIEDPSLMRDAVEELLRWVSAVVHFRRTATRDTEIAGQRIAAGDKVVLWYASGNRDETAIPDPDRLDVSRPNVEHQAFGGGGRHFCLGNQLARLELRVLFEELLERIPDMELAGEPRRLRTNFTNELTSLPVAFTPGRPSGS